MNYVKCDKEFGFEETENWMGLLHDFGKYSPRFQDVPDHRISHVDHALPGASQYAHHRCQSKNLKQSPERLCFLPYEIVRLL